MSSAMEMDWAAEVEAASHLPPPKESTENGITTRIEVMFNEAGDKIEVTSTFKMTTKRVPKVVAARRKWKKFGQSASDPPGPQVSTTMPAEEVKIQFIRNRGGELLLGNLDQNENKSLRDKTSGMHCRYCKQNDHYSVHCPYKDMLGIEEDENAPPTTPNAAEVLGSQAVNAVGVGGGGVGGGGAGGGGSGAYVPPSLRAGARPGPTLSDRRDENTVRVTNLPEDATDADLRDLFSQVGRVQRIYLAKDKQTLRSKGFAFVTYDRRDDAEKAIKTISGHKYDYVILKVEWAKQSNN